MHVHLMLMGGRIELWCLASAQLLASFLLVATLLRMERLRHVVGRFAGACYKEEVFNGFGRHAHAR